MAGLTPGDYMTRAYSNITAESNRSMVISTAIVGILTFAAMVTSAYTADHIRRSSCASDMFLDKAYKWSWVTAVIAGFTAAGMAGILIYTAVKDKK